MLETNQEIFKDVLSIVSKHSKNQDALAAATASTDILKDLQVNSARFVDIVLDFEDKFDVEISDDELDNIHTIGDCVTLVEKLLS